MVWKCVIKILHYKENPNVVNELQPIRHRSSGRVWDLPLVCSSQSEQVTNQWQRLAARGQLPIRGNFENISLELMAVIKRKRLNFGQLTSLKREDRKCLVKGCVSKGG